VDWTLRRWTRWCEFCKTQTKGFPERAAAVEQGQVVYAISHSPRFFTVGRERDRYPTPEMWVVAPAVVRETACGSFEPVWDRALS
jgi:hypothetical protein